MKLFGNSSSIKSRKQTGRSRSVRLTRRVRKSNRSHSAIITRPRSVVVVEKSKILKPLTYSEAIRRGEQTDTQYRIEFQRKVRMFLCSTLSSNDGCMLPDEMCFEHADRDRILDIKKHFITLIKPLDLRALKDSLVYSPYAQLRAHIDEFMGLCDILLDRNLSYQPVKLLSKFKETQEKLDVIDRYQGIFLNFSVVLCFLEQTTIPPLDDLLENINKEVRIFSVKEDLKAHKITGEENIENSSEISYFVFLFEFLSKMKSAYEGKKFKKKLFEEHRLKLINAFFGVSKAEIKLFSHFETLFTHYQKYSNYLHILCSIKYGYANQYFSKFQHKEVQFEIEQLIAEGNPISKKQYKAMDREAESSIYAMCSSSPYSEEDKFLAPLGQLLKKALYASDKNFSAAIRAVKRADLDSRTVLLRDSYLRMLEKLAMLKTMVVVKEDKLKLKPIAEEESS